MTTRFGPCWCLPGALMLFAALTSCELFRKTEYVEYCTAGWLCRGEKVTDPDDCPDGYVAVDCTSYYPRLTAPELPYSCEDAENMEIACDFEIKCEVSPGVYEVYCDEVMDEAH